MISMVWSKEGVEGSTSTYRVYFHLCAEWPSAKNNLIIL
jgi:hypothetical protein